MPPFLAISLYLKNKSGAANVNLLVSGPGPEAQVIDIIVSLRYFEIMTNRKQAVSDEAVEEVRTEKGSETKLIPSKTSAPAKPPATYDPLRLYLYEIGQYDLLSREEEKALAIQYYKSQDQDAAYRLVTANLRLVVKIAMEFQHYWMKNLLDLIQEGNVGLMQALRKFDPYKEVKFSYYASFWIKANILKFIMDNWHLVRVGTTQAQRKLFYNLKKEKERLLSQGMEPGPKLLAERLNVREKDIIEMDQRLNAWDVFLDAPLRDDAEDTHMNFLASDKERVDDVLAESEINSLLREKLGAFRLTLNDREQEILDRRILSEKPETLQDMGERFGISRERVRQLETRIKEKIRNYLLEEIPDLEADDYFFGFREGK